MGVDVTCTNVSKLMAGALVTASNGAGAPVAFGIICVVGIIEFGNTVVGLID